MSDEAGLALIDLEPARARFLEDCLAGLRAPAKTLPCKYFYDQRGSELFDAICELPEYYPTRTELQIMERHGDEMAGVLGDHCRVVEYGSGSSAKTRLLLDRLKQPSAYVPLDISRDHLLASAAALARDYPQLEILPVCADFTQPFHLPKPTRTPRRTAVYFPGSTIGNFEPREAVRLLQVAHRTIGSDGMLLIGVDLVKDAAILERAYDDSAGVTADFNMNLLERMNAELDADFDLASFRHRATWRPGPSRIEMHLVSLRDQTVTLGGERIDFDRGESICTEHSHKYTLASFAELGAEAGLVVAEVWMDPDRLFSVQALRAT